MYGHPTTADEKSTLPDKATRESTDRAKERVDARKLNLRAGEQVGNNPRGQANMLGMSLQEGDHGRTKVVDVTTSSPAWDAGIQKGDEIRSYQGFAANTYRKWIDGMQRLTTDAPAGAMIPLIVLRDGKQVGLQIQVPATPVRPPTTRALAQPGNPLVPPGLVPAIPTPGGPGAAPVNNGNTAVIENGSPFGEFFGGDQAVSVNEQAMAQIVRVGARPTVNPTPRVQDSGSAASNTGAAQNAKLGTQTAPAADGIPVGMAGFRDDPSGMVVMVDVGALPPGDYTVGISDPSIVGGIAATGSAANPSTQSSPQAAQPQAPVSASTQSGNLAGADPQSNLDNAQCAPTSQAGVAQKNPGPGSGTGVTGGTLNQIGTITVGQNGTGRMRQTIESTQVRNVVGQALVIYSQGNSKQTTSSTSVDGGNQGTAPSQPVVSGQANPSFQVPVAGGIIRLISDRRPAVASGPQVSETPTGPNAAVEQPANAVPPTGQNPIR